MQHSWFHSALDHSPPAGIHQMGLFGKNKRGVIPTSSSSHRRPRFPCQFWERNLSGKRPAVVQCCWCWRCESNSGVWYQKVHVPAKIRHISQPSSYQQQRPSYFQLLALFLLVSSCFTLQARKIHWVPQRCHHRHSCQYLLAVHLSN